MSDSSVPQSSTRRDHIIERVARLLDLPEAERDERLYDDPQLESDVCQVGTDLAETLARFNRYQKRRDRENTKEMARLRAVIDIGKKNLESMCQRNNELHANLKEAERQANAREQVMSQLSLELGSIRQERDVLKRVIDGHNSRSNEDWAKNKRARLEAARKELAEAERLALEDQAPDVIPLPP
ncbi:hypothetical protein IAU60_006893 [Kwoniella sp. DSM 27419]